MSSPYSFEGTEKAVDTRAAEASAEMAGVGAARARTDTARVAQFEVVTKTVRNVVLTMFVVPHHVFSVVARDVHPAHVRLLRLLSP